MIISRIINFYCLFNYTIGIFNLFILGIKWNIYKSRYTIYHSSKIFLNSTASSCLCNFSAPTAVEAEEGLP